MMNEQKCPLKCPLPARSYDSLGLVRHLKSFHSGTKFGCYMCERSFTDLNILFFHLKQHGVLPDKSKIKLFKTSSTKGVNDMLGFLNGQVKIYCNEKSPASRIDLVKNISKRIEDKDSPSDLSRPKKNENSTHILRQTAKVKLYCKEKNSDQHIPEASTIDLEENVSKSIEETNDHSYYAKDSSPSALPRPKKNKNTSHNLQQTSKGGRKKKSKYRSFINCSVIGCGTRSTDESKPSFFRFPARNKEQREAWLSIVGRKNADWVPRNSDRICSHHFENGKYSTRRDRVNYIPTLNVGLSNWKPTFNFQTLKLNFNNLDEEDIEKEPAIMVEEPATKEIEIQCDIWQEFVEEKVFTFECQFIGISEKSTQLTTSRPTNIKATSNSFENLVPVRLDKFLKFNNRAGPNKSGQGGQISKI